MTRPMPTLNEFQKWYAKYREEVLQDYFTFLRFPSISADPQYRPDMQKTAGWLIQYLKKSGMKTELWETGGHPCVFASYLEAGEDAPTVLFYNHYDVQPVDPLDLWKSDPFEPVIKEGKVYARGASDNKGQCFYVVAAVRAFIELCKNKSVNIKVFIEGEEESGGVSTEAILPKKKKELAADYLYIVDLGIPDPNTPAISLGLRGILAMEIEVTNSTVDLHSGVHGGIALNPNHALIRILSRLWDEKGRIAIPHFLDDVKTVPPEELALYDMHFDVEEYQKTFGVKAFAFDPSISALESNWLHPSLDVNGITGGYAGEGFKTVIPAKAKAKLSCRLVPNQDPQKIAILIEKTLRQHLPASLDLKVKINHGAPPYRSASDTNVVKIAKESYEEVFSKPCRLLLCGASIPIVPILSAVTQAEVALIGVGLDTDDIHAPNEHFGVDRLEKGFLTIGRIISLCSSFT